jgi:hypothetical protein
MPQSFNGNLLVPKLLGQPRERRRFAGGASEVDSTTLLKPVVDAGFRQQAVGPFAVSRER